MEIKKELLDEMISDAEEMNALSCSVPISDYNGWVVRVSIDKRELLVKR